MAKRSSARAEFQSATLSPQEPIYGDHNAHELVMNVPADQARGHMARDWNSCPHGQAWRGATAFPASLKISRDLWPEMIQEQERTKTRTSDLILAAGLPCKDQDSTNYCWINAPTHVAEVNLIQQNQRMPDGSLIILSPASVGAKVKGFRNSGGWGQEGLDYAIEHGWVPEKLWPANAISRSYDTAAAWSEAEKYKPTNFFDMQSDDFDEKASANLRRMATADGYNWWSHEVTGYDLVMVSNSVRDAARRYLEASYAAQQSAKFVGYRMGKEERDSRLELAASRFGTRQRNSWSMSYGEKGFFILTESKATPSDCCCSIDMMPA